MTRGLNRRRASVDAGVGKLASCIVAAAATTVVAVVVALVACTPPRIAETPLPLADQTRMSHARHAQLACTECHRGDARPGSQDHEPCDRGDCHAKEFLTAPGALCRACHTRVTAGADAPLRPYPDDDSYRAEPATFSHRTHLDSGRMEGRTGFHVACVDCHVRDGGLVHPDHAACARCHAAEVKLTGAPNMNDCARCHAPTTRLRARGRLIHDDLKFGHDVHRVDRRGDPIHCEECHSATSGATGYDDHPPPTIAPCVGCHDDSQRAPNAVAMRACETCHTRRASTLTTLAPRDHLPLTERPLDHTLAFRRDHAESAARDPQRCATCHTQMSGNGHDACDECHQTMVPADHRITWREYDHGPEAVADRTRCARCHVEQLCTACHAQRPRSHGPGDFGTAHAGAARIDLRPCVTCHEPEAFCGRSGCHESSKPTPRRR